MLREGTPLEDYQEQYGLWVKREDKSCVPPGPPFSKARGVYARIASRPETIIGVLDTYHSQGGHAAARACQILGKQCLDFYPEYKHDPGCREPQLRAKSLGAELIGLPAGRSAILFHTAKKYAEACRGYMLPNALKLEESIEETAKEVPDRCFDNVLISASSGTIAAGVIRGFSRRKISINRYLIHLGYTRSHDSVLQYLAVSSGGVTNCVEIVDEGYQYKDKAKPGDTPPWPCNEYYDLKAFRWWIANRSRYDGKTLFWNIG
jgi:hypothetical protein